MASTKPNEPPATPHDDFPDDWETFWRFDDDDERWVAMGRDDRDNEFQLDAGSPERVEGRCNAPLRDYERRYGEKRYCTRLPASTFPGYESDYCKTHISMEHLEERAAELFKHGYFAESYVNVAKRLSPTKFLFAVEMVGGLFEMSRYEFDVEEEPVLIDTSGSVLIEEDAVEVSLPVPTEQMYQFQANELWMAALDEVRMRKMQDIILEQGVSTSHVVATADEDGTITDRIEEGSEHHLNLPISRLTKDIKEHLKNGGVEIGAEDESGVITFQKNDYTLDVAPDDEASTDDAQPVSEVAEDFSSDLEAEDEAVIEVSE